jgi:hypothetical protein
VDQISFALMLAVLQIHSKASAGPSYGVKGGVACMKANTGQTRKPGLQNSPNWVLANSVSTDHRSVIRKLANDSHLGLHRVGLAVIHQAAVYPISGTGGASADVKSVDVEDVQELGSTCSSVDYCMMFYTRQKNMQPNHARRIVKAVAKVEHKKQFDIGARNRSNWLLTDGLQVELPQPLRQVTQWGWDVFQQIC